nr:Wzz/FepE/Etk N-terminal domain-containing protein [uncultured Pedobacter sp.]
MENKHTSFDLVDIIKVGLKYKMHIFLITLIGMIAGVAIAFIITPKYESSTIFYVPANNSISKSLLAENNLENFMSYGNEDQIDQAIEMLNSDALKDNVISKFNLINHYRLGGNTKYPKTKARNEFESNTEFKRTDNLAIKVSVKDVDPILATDMANYISACLDSMRSTIRQERGQQAYDLIKLQYHKKQTEVDSILQQLKQIREQGIFDYESQSKVLSKAMIDAQTQAKAEEARLKVYQQYQNKLPDTAIIRAKGRVEATKASYQSLKPTIANFGKLSGKYLELVALYDKEQESLADLQKRFEGAELDYKGFISQRFLIQKATVPEKSKYPNKMLFVFLFGLSAFIISFLAVCYLEFVAPRFKG